MMQVISKIEFIEIKNKKNLKLPIILKIKMGFVANNVVEAAKNGPYFTLDLTLY